jgi:hypothetical protein
MILGAGKAGTTSLYYYMAQHPEVFMCSPKEPPFFQVEYQLGADYYWKTYFRGYRGQKHAGEAAHHNLHLPYVTERIAATVPDARFIVLCRNPVERALSAYWHNVTRGIERASFEDAIDKNLRRLESGPWFNDEREARLYEAAVRDSRPKELVYTSYVDSGYYARHIERFAKVFGRDRIEVLFFEDLTSDAAGTTERALRSLGLDSIELWDASPQNQPISPGLAEMTRMVTALSGAQLVPLAWRARIRRWLTAVLKSAKPQMNPVTRRMLADHFQRHNDRLAEMTQRNLDHWN